MTWSQNVVAHLAIAAPVVAMGGVLLYIVGLTSAVAAVCAGFLAFGIWLSAGWMWLNDPDTDPFDLANLG